MKALVIVGIIVIVLGLLALLMFGGMKAIRRLVIKDVDLSKLADGVYTGTYHKGRWTYDVEVTVKDKRIVEVKNTNPRMQGFDSFNVKAALAIVKAQSPRVDVVSGATISSKAFEKAVETALESTASKR